MLTPLKRKKVIYITLVIVNGLIKRLIPIISYVCYLVIPQIKLQQRFSLMSGSLKLFKCNKKDEILKNPPYLSVTSATVKREVSMLLILCLNLFYLQSILYVDLTAQRSLFALVPAHVANHSSRAPCGTVSPMSCRPITEQEAQPRTGWPMTADVRCLVREYEPIGLRQ